MTGDVLREEDIKTSLKYADFFRKLTKLIWDDPIVKTPDYLSYALGVNLTRLRMMAAAVVVLSASEVRSLFGVYQQAELPQLVMMAFSLVFSLVLIFITLIFKQWFLDHHVFSKNLIIIFWMLVMAGDVPASYSVAVNELLPLNVTTWLAAMILLLVVTRRQIVIFYSMFLVLNLGLCIYNHIPYPLIEGTIARIVIGMIVAYFVQYPSNISYLKNVKNSSIDPLTELSNRRGGLEIMQSIIEKNRKRKLYTVVYMIDVDNFKNYNDTFGHALGDEAIKAIAESIKETFSYKDDVSIRYGGEEILCCATVDDPDIAYVLSGKVHKNVADRMIKAPDGNFQEYVTISAGFYVISHSDPEIQDLNVYISKADEALYQAKGSGKNCTIAYKPAI